MAKKKRRRKKTKETTRMPVSSDWETRLLPKGSGNDLIIAISCLGLSLLILLSELKHSRIILSYGIILFSVASLYFHNLIRVFQLVKKFPNQPWMHRQDWANGVNFLKNRGLSPFLWFITVPIVLYNLKFSKAVKSYSILSLPFIINIIFGLCSVALVCVSLYLTFAHFRYGTRTLRLLTIPGVLGGSFKAKLSIKSKLYHGSFNVTLESIYDGGRYAIERSAFHKWEEIWKDEKEINIERASKNNAFLIPISFEIPFNAKPTRDDHVGIGGVFWHLTIRGTKELNGFVARFEVPVFHPES